MNAEKATLGRSRKPCPGQESGDGGVAPTRPKVALP